jgi:hypothetical protein
MRHPNRPTRIVPLRVIAAVLGLGLTVFVIVSVGAGGGSADIRLGGSGNAGPGATGQTTSGPTSLVAASAARFSISGQVTGLYPGRTEPLTLSVTNPFKFEIFVVSVTTTEGSATPSCTAVNLSVSTFSGHVGVPAEGVAHIAVSASMSHSATDGCQGVTFPLQYSGVARRH